MRGASSEVGRVARLRLERAAGHLRYAAGSFARGPMFSRILLVACSVAALGLSCGTTCSTEARASVRVMVVDGSNRAVTDAKVTYSVEGGEEKSASCLASAGDPCTQWYAGSETAGSFLVKATSADGTRSAEKTVTVIKDPCHVLTEDVTLVLQ